MSELRQTDDLNIEQLRQEYQEVYAKWVAESASQRRREADFEKLRIALQQAGIHVDQGKFYVEELAQKLRAAYAAIAEAEITQEFVRQQAEQQEQHHGDI